MSIDTTVTIDRVPVDSTQVDSIGYDEATATLEIAFLNKNGIAVYRYANVPKSLYEGALAASSVGRFVGNEIKGHYDYVRVS